MKNQTALYISERACPSITYRIKKELFLEDITKPDMQALQSKILNESEILRIFSLKKDDGWLGGRFHGVDEPECSIRHLVEKGVEPSHPIIQDTLNAIIARGDKFDEGSMNRVGKPLDRLHFGGSKLIKACVFAYAGYENYDFVLEQVDEALDVFKFVYGVEKIEDIYDEYKNKLVFKSGVMWPCIYHLRLLAHTNCWKSAKNQEMLGKAISRLAELSPIPEIKLLYNHQIISPASVFMNNFNDDMSNLSTKDWMMWFHRTELIAKLGIATKITSIKKQIEYVNNLLNTNDGLFTKRLNHYYFTKWTQYIGLALEDNWKSTDKMINDLTFRCLLINSYQK
jgi:hypothetical protein